MADIRFKISGDTEPFSVKLWNSSCSSIVQEKVVEYPDTCVILGGLQPITTYHVNVTDNINFNISESYTTPTALIPLLPPEKNFYLEGTVYNPDEYTAFLTGDKRLLIEPPLGVGEMVDLTFNVFTCDNINITDDNVQLYRNNMAIPIKSFIDSGSENYTINNVTSIDNICYTLSSICHNGATGDIIGCSTLNLTGVNSVGSASISPNIGSPSTQKVAISATNNVFTLTPIEFNFPKEGDSIIAKMNSTESWYYENPVEGKVIFPLGFFVSPISGGAGLTDITVTATENFGITRSGQLNFIQNDTNGDFIITASLNQTGAPAAITVNPPNIFFGSGELTKNVLVTSSPYGWEIADIENDIPTWVTSVLPISSNNLETNFEINVTPLSKPGIKTDSIKFTQIGGDNITTSLVVTQSNTISPIEPPSSSDSITVRASGNDNTVNWNESMLVDITASSNWEVGFLPNFVTSVNPPSGSIENNQAEINLEENETGSDRDITVWFRLQSNTSIKDSITIKQLKM